MVNAALLTKQKQFVNANKILKSAETLSKLEGITHYLSEINFKLGNNCYAEKKDTALHFFYKGLKYAKQNHLPLISGRIHSNIGYLHVHFDEYEEALPSINKAMSIAKKVNDSAVLQEVNFTLGVYYESKDDYTKALKYYDAAVETYGKYVNQIQLSYTYWLYSGALYHTKYFEKAFDIQEKYIYLNDSVYNLEKTAQFEALRTEFEVEKKDNQITLLERENQLAATRRKWIITSSVFISLGLIGLFLYYRQRAKTQQKIRKQENELYEKEAKLIAIKSQVEGQDKERHRIAKELHDGVGGQLATVTMALSHLNTNLKNIKITSIQNSLKTTFSELRSLSHSLSETYHKEKSLTTLLAKLKQNYETQNAFTVEISIYPEESLEALPESIKHNTYRVLQELFNNTHKHSKATLVQLSLNTYEDQLVILFEDNGIGFNVKTNANGIGMKNIEERIITLNGKLHIDSAPQRGTHFSIEIPLKI